MKPGQLFKVYV